MFTQFSPFLCFYTKHFDFKFSLDAPAHLTALRSRKFVQSLALFFQYIDFQLKTLLFSTSSAKTAVFKRSGRRLFFEFKSLNTARTQRNEILSPLLVIRQNWTRVNLHARHVQMCLLDESTKVFWQTPLYGVDNRTDCTRTIFSE